MFPILQDTNEACPHFCYFISVSWWKLFSEFFPDGFCNTTNWSLLSLILQWQEYRILLLCHSVLYVFIFLYLWHLPWFMAISFHGITFENKTFASRLWHFNVFLLPLHVSLRHLSCKIGNSCYVTFAIEKNLTSIIFRSLVASRPAKCHFQSVLLYWPWTCLGPSFFFLSSMHLTLSWQTVVPWSAFDKWIYLRTTSLSPKHSPGLAFSQPPKANTLNARKKVSKVLQETEILPWFLILNGHINRNDQTVSFLLRK